MAMPKDNKDDFTAFRHPKKLGFEMRVAADEQRVPLSEYLRLRIAKAVRRDLGLGPAEER